MNWQQELAIATRDLTLLTKQAPPGCKVIPGQWTFTKDGRDVLPDEDNIVIASEDIQITVGDLRLMVAIVAARTRIERAQPPEPEAA